MGKKCKQPFGRPSLYKGPTIDKIDCRIPAKAKRAMLAEAKRCDISLSEWVRRTLSAEVDRQLEVRKKKE